MSNRTFSVVIPAYNSVLSIAETVESVLAQSWKDLEVLVVDDGSTDATPDIVQDFERRDSRVRLVRCPNRFGRPAGPRNIGIRQSSGDYVAFLDSDDVWKADKLANDATYLSANPVAFLYSGCEYFIGRLDNIVAVLDPPQIGPMIMFRNLIMIQTVCIDRRVFLEQGLLFDEEPRLRGIEDYHFILETYLRRLPMARRAGSDVLYRKNSATSIYPRRNLPLLLYRHGANLQIIRQKYRLPVSQYCFFLAMTMLYKSTQAVIGRA